MAEAYVRSRLLQLREDLGGRELDALVERLREPFDGSPELWLLEAKLLGHPVAEGFEALYRGRLDDLPGEAGQIKPAR